MSGGQRAAVLIAATVDAVVAFIVLRPDDAETPETDKTTTTQQPADTTGAETTPERTTPDETTPEARPQEPEAVTIRVKGGRPVGGVQTIEAKQDETVRFSVTSDEAHEIHLHGYDIAKDAEAGEPVEFRVKADETGVFEVELEDTKTQIAELKVEP